MWDTFFKRLINTTDDKVFNYYPEIGFKGVFELLNVTVKVVPILTLDSTDIFAPCSSNCDFF